MDPKHRPAPLPPIEMEGERAVAFDCLPCLGPDGPVPMTGVTHLRFADLTAALLARMRPSLILLPLFSPGYDATTAIETLEALGYRGRLTILAPDLPKPRLVERELRNLGPGMRLTLISP